MPIFSKAVSGQLFLFNGAVIIDPGLKAGASDTARTLERYIIITSLIKMNLAITRKPHHLPQALARGMIYINKLALAFYSPA